MAFSKKFFTLEIIITAWKEEKTTYDLVLNALKAYHALKNHNFLLEQITIIAPDKNTLNAGKQAYKKYTNNNPQIKTKINLIQDPQKGKPFALNLVLPKLKKDITIFTDGDVVIKPQAFVKLVKPFKTHKNTVATTGSPVPLNSRNSMLGFWAWLTTQAGAHQHRLLAYKYKLPLNVSGYLFAAKTKILPKSIPATLKAEDAYFSYIFRKKGDIIYTPRARVYVMFPKNFKDWIKQKVRAVGGDHQLNMMFANDKQFKNMRSFSKEVKGISTAIKYPKNLKEWIYFLLLVFARLYLWILIFWQYNILKKPFNTMGWQRIESTKITK